MDSSTRSTAASLRVLQIASGDIWAGAEVQFYYLCEQLEQHEQITLDVVLLNEGELADRLRAIGVSVSIFDESSLSFWQISYRFARHCRRMKPDIIHSHRQKENVLTGLMRLFFGIRSVRTVHGAAEFSYPLFSAKRIIAGIDKLTGRYLQYRVAAVSEDLKHKLRVHYPDSHLAVVRNGLPVGTSEIQQLTAGQVEFAQGLRHIGIVGRLVKVKRIDIFLRMAALLRDDGGTGYCFWVIGDGPLRAQHCALANQLGIAEAVNFVGHVPSASPYLQKLDLLVMCSDHEGTPMTLLEAWQSGTPVIANDVGGLRELLDQGDCGCLVARHEPGEYAAAVSRILGDETLRARYIQQGHRRLQQHYSAEQNAQAYIHIYRQASGY